MLLLLHPPSPFDQYPYLHSIPPLPFVSRIPLPPALALLTPFPLHHLPYTTLS